MQSATSPLGITHRSGSLQDSLAGKALLVIGATAFVAACAHISFPLPFTPVPLTLQNFAVILVGMALGPVAGFSAMVLYLAEGALGLPVFTPSGGPTGVVHLLGPNGGFDDPMADLAQRIGHEPPHLRVILGQDDATLLTVRSFEMRGL